MATAEEERERSAPAGARRCALDPEGPTDTLGLLPGSGLSAGEAAERPRRGAPNALPAQEPPSAVRRFAAQFATYKQLRPVGAAVISLVIKQWSTSSVLIEITRFKARPGRVSRAMPRAR
jgi:Ca2+-transporting ATPase